MANRAKRSLTTLPKGLPQRKKQRGGGGRGRGGDVHNSTAANVNPFENARPSSSKPAKFQVHNRPTAGGASSGGGPASALARSISRRKQSLRASLKESKKAGAFVDRRIGEGPGMTEEQRMLARVVRERARRSRRATRFALDDDDEEGGGAALGSLTHKGKPIDDSYSGNMGADDVILSDDDEGQLDRVDTEMHFGGGSFDRAKVSSNPYGPSGGSSASMGDVYRSRKEELDDMIRRRKEEKAERARNKEEQLETFEGLDESFKELAGLLQFRDKEKERQEKWQAKKAGTQSEEDKEMDAWDKEMKEYLFERKVKATDRTKTPEEIAKEEAERLHELETRRLARMEGDFEEDDLLDISDDEEKGGRRNRRGKGQKSKSRKKEKSSSASAAATHKNPDELDSDEEEETDEPQVRFTADGLVYVDKEGNVVRKVGDDESNRDDNASEDGDNDDEEEESSKDGEDSDESEGSDNAGLGDSKDEASAADSDDKSITASSDDDDDSALLAVGTRVKGNYHAEEQFDGMENWYEGVINKVSTDKSGNTLYDVTYDDGDFEEGMKTQHVRRVEKSRGEKETEKAKKDEISRLKMKRQKAKEKARASIPFTFEVPTTLEALHEMIGTYATTGADASLIVQRIHSVNSVRLNSKNKEKMQNFYDVLLRRFVAVGDAIYASGDGGPDLGRYDQLDCLTQTLYAMAQDSPECAGAVWGRRLGFFQKALAKRLRDADLVSGDEDDDDAGPDTAWPSTGTFSLLRALGHIFPATDLRHAVVTPSLLLLGQTISQCPVKSIADVVMGILCSGLLIEYTKEAKRIAPEALAFLAGVLRSFALDACASAEQSPVPCFELAVQHSKLATLRVQVVEYARRNLDNAPPSTASLQLSIEKDKIESASMPAAILCSTLRLVEVSARSLGGSINNTETEVFEELSKSLLCLKPKSKSNPLPQFVADAITKAARAVSIATKSREIRTPILRRSGATVSQLAIKSLAPRMEDPTRYAMSKDKGKSQRQAILDRNRREYKREHKAATRELRLDAAFIENERRKDKERRDTKARDQRHKNFAWLEQEQATMNQQVRLGGGLLKGGGIGAARTKAATGKLGIKKGGKMR